MKTEYNKTALAGTGFYLLLAAGIFFNTFTYLAPQWERDDFTYCSGKRFRLLNLLTGFL